jgi:hypothetical protein
MVALREYLQDQLAGAEASTVVVSEAANGEYVCTVCGYGVAVFRDLLRCPMCSESSWVRVDRRRRARSSLGWWLDHDQAG